ncbi:hypothetical protein [Blastococcus sp. VKM Ac-2987]|uniref:hypothetical protein n=1 Tax=Blastococcus sp. VKM Ac-2987 TaxID=3004141 RepID=UPI0022AB9087|nr:hypothetical protein [Blastococcus sp. VKM Ac-2987]MCZ2860999.1 hypothetical protein [Blastococcus sp. VKM Ac-2987]
MRFGAPLAVVSLLLLGAFWIGSASASDASGTVLRAALGAGIVGFVAAAACFLPSRRPRP